MFMTEQSLLLYVICLGPDNQELHARINIRCEMNYVRQEYARHFGYNPDMLTIFYKDREVGGHDTPMTLGMTGLNEELEFYTHSIGDPFE
ncbi:hypothetical protein QR680_011063 [Steinernema hermaphroditum]|uniref:Ubiquitin-like domain-containing protein n=1 Tax=Steinernema hermaphroditum TaxID=289476 RepID=A0AA39MCK7_9BILA|nr:hypothetical protein QR680_011063 [Steinernema hermaphroditum]